MTDKKVFLITGTSAGFGHTLAHDALRRGHHVIATTRGDAPTRLSALAAAGATVLSLDVTASTSDIAAFAAAAEAVHGRIDVLVNNAGVSTLGAVEELSDEDWARQFETNYFGAVRLTRALLPGMRARGSGVVAFMSSVMALVPSPGAAGYAATKAALSMVGECLALEVAEFGIEVVAVEPGFFNTDLPVRQSRSERVAAYGEGSAVRGTERMIEGVMGNQTGDQVKGMRVVNDVLLKKDGRKIPSRLVLGSDGNVFVRTKLQETLVLMDEWKDVTTNTDVEKA